MSKKAYLSFDLSTRRSVHKEKRLREAKEIAQIMIHLEQEVYEKGFEKIDIPIRGIRLTKISSVNRKMVLSQLLHSDDWEKFQKEFLDNLTGVFETFKEKDDVNKVMEEPEHIIFSDIACDYALLYLYLLSVHEEKFNGLMDEIFQYYNEKEQIIKENIARNQDVPPDYKKLYEESLKKVQAEREISKQKKKKIKELETKVNTYKENLGKMSSTNNKVKHQNSKSKNEIAMLRSENSKLRDEKSMVENKNNLLEHEKKQIEERIEKVDDENSKLRKRNSVLKITSDEMKKSNTKLKEDIKVIEERIQVSLQKDKKNENIEPVVEQSECIENEKKAIAIEKEDTIKEYILIVSNKQNYIEANEYSLEFMSPKEALEMAHKEKYQHIFIDKNNMQISILRRLRKCFDDKVQFFESQRGISDYIYSNVEKENMNENRVD